MKKRILNFVLSLVMVCTMMPIAPLIADAATSIASTPLVQIEYNYSNTVSCGTIRYISQSTNSTYFNWNYWPKTSFGEYASPGSECGTACISMALSYVGVNKTPIEILGSDGITKWDQWSPAKWSGQYSDITNSIENAYVKYVNGNGKYGPIVVHLNIGQSYDGPYDYGHFIILVAKENDNTWKVVDPATNEVKNYTINGNKMTYMGVNNTIDQVHQFYNPNASICNHNYNNLGICQSTCKGEFNWQATYDSSCAGIYKVSLSGGIYLRTDKPYSASTAKSNLIKEGTKVQVLGSVLNAVGKENHLWYKVSYNGAIGYTSEDNLTLIPHTCDQGTYMYFEAVHPHRSCYSCSICGKIWAVDGSSNYYESCNQCGYAERPGKPVLQVYSDYTDTSPTVFTWKATANTTHYNLYILKQLSDGSYDAIERIFYAQSGVSRTLEAGNYCIQLLSTNSNGFEANGVDWLYTMADNTYFTVASCAHSYSSSVTTSATCLVDGVLTYTCSKCGQSYTEPILATGYHSWGAWGIRQAASCTATGIKYRLCYVCGEEETQSIDMTAHNYVLGCCTVCGTSDPNWTNVASGTCGENLFWTLSSEGTLIISGTGSMTDYSPYIGGTPTPWNDIASSIRCVSIKKGVTSIGNYAFYKCSNLASVTIPNGVISIGNHAFYECSNLVGAVIPNGVAIIGGFAFYNCDSLININVPDSVDSIGRCAFNNCSSLQEISVGEANQNYCNDSTGVLFNKVKTILICAPGTICGSYTIPDSVTSIDPSAFSDCINLLDIIIPNSVVSIGGGAFSGCVSLKSIIIPDSVTNIGDSVCSHCEALEQVTISRAITTIPFCSFNRCTSLTNVIIPESVTYIDGGAFYGCANLTNIKIPASVTKIWNDVFQMCSNLEHVYYGGTETQWNTIVMGPNNDDLFDATIHFSENIASGTCGEKLTWTLSEAGALVISGSGTMYDYSSGNGNNNYAPWNGVASLVKEIVIEDGVCSIGDYAFYECIYITEINIPDSVTSIGTGAFVRCENLCKIKIGSGVKSIGYLTFAYCYDLVGIFVSDENPQYSSDINGVLFNKDKTTLVAAPGAISTYTVPDSVTYIDKFAFYACQSLTLIEIPDSVISIGESAFYGCGYLQTVKIPNSVVSIGDLAFTSCHNLHSITLGNHVESIGWGAVSDCYRLEKVYYAGSERQWNIIQILDNNLELIRAERHYNYYWIDNICDFDNNTAITDADAVYLLRHTLFPDVYPLCGDGDTNSDGFVTDSDAVYLLRYTLFPDVFPLYPADEPIVPGPVG